MSGIGKSSVAIAIGHKFKVNYENVLYIDGANLIKEEVKSKENHMPRTE